MRHSLSALLFALLCVSGVANGQVTDSAPTPDQEPATQTDAEQVLAQSNEPQSEEGNEADAEENADGQSRFIPTEQISQDLGVSFPADI